MKGAIMQPYFLPYIGYFQLIASVDQFIVYDNIKYTKKGWINRNRMLLNGIDAMFSLPLKKGSDSLDVVERELATDFDRAKLLNQFKGAYGRAPQFELTYPVLERIVCHEDANLFRYIHHSIVRLCEHLGTKTEIKISSEIAIDHGLKGQDKVLALCKAAGADTYINTIGGVELYVKDDFRIQGIDLQFIKARPFEYAQFGAPFVPWLSIVDVLMFNPLNTVRACINENYDLV
ncbi:MAG: WbqC family protein [Simplicispira suum]|uniref:WbqC family protein n=1 Tax=Simplicispira suum TaxID=2109915 RepID=UPI001C6AF641|nr:WbqC family protein [Simplicispira suum]MBW7832200.1 WbqC family protein [Simplicispira suum]